MLVHVGVCVCVTGVEQIFPGENRVRFLLWHCCGPARLKIAANK